MWFKNSLQKIQEFQEIEGTKGAISRKHLLLPSDLRPTGPLSLDGGLHPEHPNEQCCCHNNQGGNRHLNIHRIFLVKYCSLSGSSKIIKNILFTHFYLPLHILTRSCCSRGMGKRLHCLLFPMFGFLRGPSSSAPNESPGKRLICILITDNHYWSQTSKKPRAEAGVESGETNKQEQPDEQIFWWKQRNTKGCNRTNTDEKSTTNQSLTLCPFSSAHIVFNHIREWGILFLFWDRDQPSFAVWQWSVERRRPNRSCHSICDLPTRSIAPLHRFSE